MIFCDYRMENMWPKIRKEALDLVAKINPTSKFQTLDQYILGTGYALAPEPFSSRLDLFTVYAANLRNTSGRGPSIEAFSLMVRTVIENQKLIQDNKLVRPLHISDFSKACADYLKTPSALPLANNTQIDYHGDLIKLSEGAERERALINGIIKSVVGFSGVLFNAYGGDAVQFHENNDRACDPLGSTKFVVDAYESLMHMHGVGGVALAMNFFKDSQAPSKRGIPLSEWDKTQSGWFVKPDMHILRFMLAATGRADTAGLRDDDLVHLEQSEAVNIYVKCNPRKSWSSATYAFDIGQPASKVGQWRCVEDVHSLAKYLKISPLEIDRILFMIGSGNFAEDVRDSRGSKGQVDRYRRLLPLIRELAGENTAGSDQFISPLSPPVKVRTKAGSQIRPTNSGGDVYFKKIRFGEWGRKVKLQKILKRLVLSERDLMEANKLVLLLQAQRESKSAKSEDFFEAICRALEEGAALNNLVECAEAIPINNYDTQVRFIVRGSSVISRR